MVLQCANPTKSYWIEAANSPLKDFRSDAALPDEVDVVIIGSGYTGATAAYWIHKYTEKTKTTPRILLLEARDICGSATGRNGGHLRPHAYSRYPLWAARFGPEGAMALIEHEMTHLTAFQELLAHEGITDEVCFKLGETFDAAMTQEAWNRLKGAYRDMKRDHGPDHEVVKLCRIIEDSRAAEEFSQMKGCIGAVVHPSGQIWPYKFVHALLHIVLKSGNLNLQSHTPVVGVSKKGNDGFMIVQTERGSVRTKSVIHATNRWASHLLPEFGTLIQPVLATIAAIDAPRDFIRHTGAQHWDESINNYHLQLPFPHNAIIVGGAKVVLVQNPSCYINNDREDKCIEGVPTYFQSWAKSSIEGWQDDSTGFAKEVDGGGCWTVEGSSSDGLPFVGPLPNRPGHFIAAGFTGHGMPRILLSTEHIAQLVLKFMEVDMSDPPFTLSHPPLPIPFQLTTERLAKL